MRLRDFLSFLISFVTKQHVVDLVVAIDLVLSMVEDSSFIFMVVEMGEVFFS
jgi:hypothetical protein